MPWSANFLEECRVVELRYRGIITPAQLQASMIDAMALGLRHGCHRYLTNCTLLRGGHSVVDLYRSAEAVEQLQCQIGTALKEALVLPSDQPAVAEDVNFWETATRNRGLNVRAFRDEGEAP